MFVWTLSLLATAIPGVAAPCFSVEEVATQDAHLRVSGSLRSANWCVAGLTLEDTLSALESAALIRQGNDGNWTLEANAVTLAERFEEQFGDEVRRVISAGAIQGEFSDELEALFDRAAAMDSNEIYEEIRARAPMLSPQHPMLTRVWEDASRQQFRELPGSITHLFLPHLPANRALFQDIHQRVRAWIFAAQGREPDMVWRTGFGPPEPVNGVSIAFASTSFLPSRGAQIATYVISEPEDQNLAPALFSFPGLRDGAPPMDLPTGINVELDDDSRRLLELSRPAFSWQETLRIDTEPLPSDRELLDEVWSHQTDPINLFGEPTVRALHTHLDKPVIAWLPDRYEVHAMNATDEGGGFNVAEAVHQAWTTHDIEVIETEQAIILWPRYPEWEDAWNVNRASLRELTNRTRRSGYLSGRDWATVHGASNLHDRNPVLTRYARLLSADGVEVPRLFEVLPTDARTVGALNDSHWDRLLEGQTIGIGNLPGTTRQRFESTAKIRTRSDLSDASNTDLFTRAYGGRIVLAGAELRVEPTVRWEYRLEPGQNPRDWIDGRDMWSEIQIAAQAVQMAEFENRAPLPLRYQLRTVTDCTFIARLPTEGSAFSWSVPFCAWTPATEPKRYEDFPEEVLQAMEESRARFRIIDRRGSASP